jgi:hypothetical protein
MNNKFYKVTNVSGQEVRLIIKDQNGNEIEDKLEVNEICYGIEERAAYLLRWYEIIGLIKIEEADKIPDKVNWLAEGF